MGSLLYLGSNMYVYAEFAAEAVKDNFIYMRALNSLFGVLSIYLVYKIASMIKRKVEGIIAATISSVSLSLLTWSKMILMDYIFMFFFLLAIYIYLIFLKKKSKRWLFALFVVMTITLGTRNMHPLILLVALSIHYYLYAKKKINYYFYYLMALSLIIIFIFVYPPYVAKMAVDQFAVNSLSIKFALFDLLNTLLFRHSLLLSFVFLADLYFFFKLKMYKKLSKQPILFILLILFLIFSITPYGSSVKYCFVFVPLMSIVFSRLYKNLIVMLDIHPYSYCF